MEASVLRIGQAAKLSGISAKLIGYYEANCSHLFVSAGGSN
jgi:hypothetical protein